MIEWTRSTFVIVRKKFGLIGSNIDVRWALAFATFARKTEIHRFFDSFVMPTALKQLALEHLEKQMRAPTGAVDLFPRHLITRAYGSSISLEAGADTDTTLGRFFKRPLVIRKAKMRLYLRRIIISPE